jgi:hypothetical protein
VAKILTVVREEDQMLRVWAVLVDVFKRIFYYLATIE